MVIQGMVGRLDPSMGPLTMTMAVTMTVAWMVRSLMVLTMYLELLSMKDKRLLSADLKGLLCDHMKVSQSCSPVEYWGYMMEPSRA
jgi:hypothetical protein